MTKTRGMNLFTLISTLGANHTARVEYDELRREINRLKYDNKQLETSLETSGRMVEVEIQKRELWQNRCAKLEREQAEARQAMSVFCDRVEAGEVRSTRTYGAFCKLLGREVRGFASAMVSRANPGARIMVFADGRCPHEENQACGTWGCKPLDQVGPKVEEPAA